MLRVEASGPDLIAVFDLSEAAINSEEVPSLLADPFDTTPAN